MRYLVTVILFSFMNVANAQQRAMFTQYMFNGLAINPAYSSVDDALSFTGVYRQQWTGFDGAPNTQSFSVHSPLKSSHTSVGFMLIRDHIGEVITETGTLVSISQRVKLDDDTYLAAGLVGGLSAYKANYSSLYDPISGSDPLFEDQSDSQLDLGFGLMWFTKDFYVGFSSPFFISKNIKGTGDGVNNRAHFLLTGGYILPLGETLKLKPYGLVKYVNGSPLQIDLNASLLIAETLWLGASWRSFDSVDAIAQIELTENVQIGYSYDFTTSALTKTNKGSHEFMLKYRLPVKGLNFPKCYF
ncbi:type IX secretion system membrane protein PorP/SprF [Daejeonella sp.]|uniref:PorP/SprF family type IX secretion system membrane protein n=1 Tax=Daejeonella sp. TaxID=2805397 RepID=UPI0030BC391D